MEPASGMPQFWWTAERWAIRRAERLSTMPRKPKYRKPYPPEFRREAVALHCPTDRTLGELAHDLGVSRESLRRGSRTA